MRIVAVADTHLFHHDLTVPDGDVFVHAGDMCRLGSFDELEIAATWIRELPHTTKIVVAGNHDWAFVRDRARAASLFGPNTIYLEDAACEIHGVRFYGSPWQPEFADWAFNLPRGAALREKWSMIPADTEVLITHGPPLGIGDTTRMARRSGCEELRARVEAIAPRLHLFGHIHEDGGLWTNDRTWFANVTTWECDRAPTVIDLDLASRVLTPAHVPPRTLRY